MKVCILSDSHDNRELLYNAVRDAKTRGAEAILHCGDVVAPSTLKEIREFNLPIHVIHGNNTGDLHMMSRIAGKPNSVVRFYGQDAGITLGGKRIFLVHYPHYARALATTGDWDLVCYGHDHKKHLEDITNIKGGTTVLANPGTVGGVEADPTYLMADLESMTLEFVDVQPD